MSFSYKYNYAQVARDSGFQLRIFKDGPLDWRLMGSVEVERMVRDQCLEQIDSVLSHLSEAPLGSILESNILDSGIAKYFVLSQFSIQYLLFCRKFLEETVADLRQSHGSAQIEVASLKKSLSEANNEILQLNKRITQMEAIHEVIYPCHLCTKNFVSNDALNLHISRKHSNNVNVKPDLPSAKDRENDLSLINTIKLELEIKHLKERLNNAERKFKEGTATPSSSREKNECENQVTHPAHPATNSIGIQSNLSEMKEQDEKIGSPHLCHSVEQLSHLNESLLDLNRWKEEQRHQSSEFLVEINSKLKELTDAIEQQKQQMPNQDISTSKATLDELDALLSRKVEEIGKTTFNKLNDVVYKLECNYKEKLEELERKADQQTQQQTNPQSLFNPVKDSTEPPTKAIITDQTQEVAKNIQIKGSSLQQQKTLNKKIVSESESSDQESNSHSNHTFTKPMSQKQEIQHDDTDVSTDESEEIVEENLTPSSAKHFGSNGREQKLGGSPKHLENKTEEISNRETRHRPKSTVKPRSVTRKETSRLLKSRLTELGVDKQATHLTATSMNIITNELSGRRHKLKEKYPNFYATRNRIKKIVDKLCSSKLPENAQALLKATRPQGQLDVSSNQHKISHPFSSDEEETNLVEKHDVSTTRSGLHSAHNAELKQRLESILASPIRMPEENIRHHVTEHKVPVPLPRKKVMFNHKEGDDILSSSGTDGNASNKKRILD
ncbi:DAZ interacting zinc finger protein 1 [Musca autumnalis]|uniref:DAZ interacting zinc finger protein 1 n=1 Tax=Musca autumnalis TaxID=221902 RepID=UPI003CE9EE80